MIFVTLRETLLPNLGLLGMIVRAVHMRVRVDLPRTVAMPVDVNQARALQQWPVMQD